jgi:hypothetical protein
MMRAPLLTRSLATLVGLVVVGTLAPAVANAETGRVSSPAPRVALGRSLGATPPNERVEFDLVLSAA